MTDLARIFQPKSIAVIGGDWAANVCRQLLKSGYEGEIWPVHPTKTEVHGLPVYPTVDALPGSPDTSFIGVNRELSIGVIRQLHDKGAGGAVCFASGFLESESENKGGAALQNQLIEAAGDMPVLGPNCYGYLNYLDNVTVWPDQHGGTKVESGVAILTQSSNIAISFTMQQRGLPIAHVVTSGNQAVVGMAEIASNLLDDPRVTVIGMHVEGFNDIRAFEALAAKSKRLKKPIVVFKVGKSEQAQAATITHTASLAGSNTGASAFIKRLGFVQVDSIPVFLETLKLLHVAGPLAGNKIGSISCSGGEASIMSDAAVNRNLSYKKLSKTTALELKTLLGPIVTVANPLDYHTFIWGDVDAMRKTYAALISDNLDLSFFVFDLPRADRCDPTPWYPAIEALKQAVIDTGAKVAVVSTMPENMPEDIADDLAANGITPLYGVEEAHAAAEAAYIVGKRLALSPVRELHLLDENSTQNYDIETLGENDAKSRLHTHGITVPNFTTFDSVEEIAATDIDFPFPVALKAMGISHKTEQNAVHLGLENKESLIHCAKQMANTGHGFLVEEMIEDVVAELLIGVTRDPAHGLLLTVGAGGILTELLKDSFSDLLPTTRQEIEIGLSKLKISRIISGYRGKIPGDIASAIDEILKIGDFALKNAQNIEEMDINPLLVCQQGSVVADALITLRET